MKITKLGHCCLIIEIDGVRFLTDPGNYTTAQDEATNIDAIVISHEHTDHLHVESLKAVLANNPKAQVITNSSVGKILDQEGISYICIANGDSMKLNGADISGHGLKHAPIFRDYEQVENTGYLFGGRLFYPGDAFHDPGFPVDILAFPVSGPWCNINDAMDYALKMKPKKAIPVHDGNLLRPNGITKRLPGIVLPEAGIEFHALELGKEYEF